MRDLTEIMGRLNPKTKERLRLASEVQLERLRTPSASLNLALGGGIGYGHQTLIWGNKSAGKSSFTFGLIAEAQRNNKFCALIDAEGTFDEKWARRFGVDVDLLMTFKEQTTQGVFDIGTDLLNSGVELLIVDSISSLNPSSFFTDKGELKEFEGTHKIASVAADMQTVVNGFNYSSNGAAIVLVSQSRTKMGKNYVTQQPSGGQSVIFMSSTIIKLTASETDKNQIKEEIDVGGKLVKKNVGRPVNWDVQFNKLGPPSSTGTYNFYYRGDSVGVDSIGEILALAAEYSIVTVSGSWWKFDGDLKFHGEDAARTYLLENPGAFEQLKERVEKVIAVDE